MPYIELITISNCFAKRSDKTLTSPNFDESGLRIELDFSDALLFQQFNLRAQPIDSQGMSDGMNNYFLRFFSCDVLKS